MTKYIIVITLLALMVGCGTDQITLPDPDPVNLAPVISKLVVDPVIISLGSQAFTHVTVSDPDNLNSELKFYWQSTGGEMNNNGAEWNVYTPFYSGNYVIMLTVCDPGGLCDYAEKPIQVIQ